MPNGEGFGSGGGIEIPVSMIGAETLAMNAELISRSLRGMFPGDVLGKDFAKFTLGMEASTKQATRTLAEMSKEFLYLGRNMAYLSGHGMMLGRTFNILSTAAKIVGVSTIATGAAIVGLGIGIGQLIKWGAEYGKYALQLEKINDVSRASSIQVQKLAQVFQLQGKSVADLNKIMAEMEKAGINPMAEGFERLAKSMGMTAPELSAALGNLKGFTAYTPEMVAALREQEDAVNKTALAWLNYKNYVSIQMAGPITFIKGITAGILERAVTPSRGRVPQEVWDRQREGIQQEPSPLGAGWGRDIGRWRGTTGAPDFKAQAETTAKWMAEQDKQMGARLDLTKSMTGATEDYAKSLEELNKQLQEAYVKGDKEAIIKTGEQIKIVTEERGKQQSEWILSMLKSTEDISQKAVEQFMLGVGLTTQQQLDYYDKIRNLIKGGDIQGLIRMALQVPTISMAGAPAEKPRFWRPQDFPDIKGYREKIRAAQLARLEPWAEISPVVPSVESKREVLGLGAEPSARRAAQAPGINIDLYKEGLRGAKQLQSDLGNAALTDGQNIALGLQPALAVVDDIKQTYLDFINAPASKTVTVTYISRYITEQAVDLTP